MVSNKLVWLRSPHNLWHQSCTTALFTLFPVVMFGLVGFLKMKNDYKIAIETLQRNNTEMSRTLQKVLEDNKAFAEKAKENSKEATRLTKQNRILVDKAHRLKSSIKSVADKALNMSSTLLLKEVEAGIAKKENIELMEKNTVLEKNQVKAEAKIDILKNLTQSESQANATNHSNLTALLLSSSILSPTPAPTSTTSTTTNTSSLLMGTTPEDNATTPTGMLSKLIDIERKANELKKQEMKLISNLTSVNMSTNNDTANDAVGDLTTTTEPAQQVQQLLNITDDYVRILVDVPKIMDASEENKLK